MVGVFDGCHDVVGGLVLFVVDHSLETGGADVALNGVRQNVCRRVLGRHVADHIF